MSQPALPHNRNSSRRPEAMMHEIRAWEESLRRADIAVSHPPPAAVEHVPHMLGHTKGNTASNRKVQPSD